MSLESLMTRDVTIQRASTATNRYGDTRPAWEHPTETDVKGWVSQASSDENIEPGRLAEVTDWALYLPAGTDIVAEDRVVIDADTYELVGPPNRARTPAGEHHIEARLRLVDG